MQVAGVDHAAGLVQIVGSQLHAGSWLLGSDGITEFPNERLARRVVAIAEGEAPGAGVVAHMRWKETVLEELVVVLPGGSNKARRRPTTTSTETNHHHQQHR